MTTKELTLVERLERGSGPDRDLDTAIARRLGVSVMRHDPETGTNYETTNWRYTDSLDSARSISDWVVVIASDIHADGLALVELGDPSTTPPGKAIGIHSNLARAWCIAALRARGLE